MDSYIDIQLTSVSNVSICGASHDVMRPEKYGFRAGVTAGNVPGQA